jgi:hypothetical protein
MGHLESGRDKILDSLNAFLDVKDRVALMTVKVMMVSPVGAFIAGCLSRDFDRTGKPFLLQRFERTVNRRNAKRGDRSECKPMDFVWQEGAMLLRQHRLDSLFLFCAATFDAHEETMRFNSRYFKPATIAETL